MAYKIESGIPVPCRAIRVKRALKYDALAKLSIGQSISEPLPRIGKLAQKAKARMNHAVATYRKRTGFRYLAREMMDDKTSQPVYRVWRVKPKDAPVLSVVAGGS